MFAKKANIYERLSDLAFAMCHSIHLRYDVQRLNKHFRLVKRSTETWSGSAELVAQNLVPTIEWNSQGQVVLQMARFGFSPKSGDAPITSFQSEAINTRDPSHVFMEGRCLVPADTFTEKVVDKAGQSSYLSYGSLDDSLMGLAGMLRPEAGGLAVTILTVPSMSTGSLHGRKSSIIHPEDYDAWLDETTSAKDAFEIVKSRYHVGIVARLF